MDSKSLLCVLPEALEGARVDSREPWVRPERASCRPKKTLKGPGAINIVLHAIWVAKGNPKGIQNGAKKETKLIQTGT